MKRLIILLVACIAMMAVGDAYAQRSKKNSGHKRPKTTKVVRSKKKAAKKTAKAPARKRAAKNPARRPTAAATRDSTNATSGDGSSPKESILTRICDDGEKLP